MLAADFEFIVQVRARCQTRGADIADNIALRNTLSAMNTAGIAGHVTIHSSVAALVVNYDHIAVTAMSANKRYHSICGRLDFGAGWRCIVNTFVCTPSAQYGVEA